MATNYTVVLHEANFTDHKLQELWKICLGLIFIKKAFYLAYVRVSLFGSNLKSVKSIP